MATLVLGAVGGAIGGPVGRAVGAVVGSVGDRLLLGAARARQGRVSRTCQSKAPIMEPDCRVFTARCESRGK